MFTSALPSYPLDLVLVKGFKSRDPDIYRTSVDRFFYKDLCGLIDSIRLDLFQGTVAYDEIVCELYLYLSEDGWKALDAYTGESRLTAWVGCLAWQYFTDIYRGNTRAMSEKIKDGIICEI